MLPKKRVGKRKGIEEKGYDDDDDDYDEFKGDKRVDAIKVNDVISGAFDFLTNEEMGDLQQVSDNGKDSNMISRFLKFNEEIDM